MVLQTSETQKPYKICTKVIKSREKKKYNTFTRGIG